MPQGETRVEIGRKLIAAMKEAHLPPVYGFVNGVAIEREPASAPMLKEWRDAGFQLGNHTWSHMNLNTNSAAEWEADLQKDEPVLQQYDAGGDCAIRFSQRVTRLKSAPKSAASLPHTATGSRR